MNLVDTGTGPPLILIPGVQGRWEWMRPTVDALASTFRVLTFSLADEPTAAAAFDPARGFDNYVQQVLDAMDTAQVARATICGVSYGGLIASTFAARHPERVTALVLVSALPPGWQPDDRVRFYLRAPRLLAPLFCLASVRMYREIAAAVPGRARSLAVGCRHAITALRHPFSPSRMARRVGMVTGLDLLAPLRALDVPTLIVTGDEDLDRVVPVRRTREYLALWPRAQAACLPRTGHLGSIVRAREFADCVTAFVRGANHDRQRRRIG